MYVLTEGDERFIAESSTVWRMYINQILFGIGSCPHEVEDKIYDLENDYRRGFKEYFLEAREKDDTFSGDVIHNEFDAAWRKSHPEFFDIDQMFDGISSDDLAKVEKLMKEANKAFQE